MFIYKITHKSTHQAYIGQTDNVFHRWEKHYRDSDTPIQKAIKEEGVINFTFEVLEQCSQQEADAREAFWINYYHTYTNGYNTNRGNGVQNTQTDNMAIQKPQIANNNRGKNNSPDGVDAYDPLTGELVAHYPTIAAANEAVGGGRSGNISAVCRGRGRTAYGYIWKYTTPQNKEQQEI